MRICLTAALLLGSALVPAAAADVSGVWIRDNGEAKVRIAPCGGALCGTVVWVKDAAEQAEVGRRVFWDMVPDGHAVWRGKAFNPMDGRTYTGKLNLEGSAMTTSGCVLGGLICQSMTWTRSR
jgi:uncharacterized protein (DUF2147 family)